MPKIESCDWEKSIVFELSLHNKAGFIYDKNQADYMNWIPYNFSLAVREKEYAFQDAAFSLEGLKTFLSRLQAVIEEKDITKEYKEYEYYSTEAEFGIYLKNTDDHFTYDIVLVKIWINAACLENMGAGYSIGFEFIVKYGDLKKFRIELQQELSHILMI